jgi:GTP cyclohydrolase I
MDASANEWLLDLHQPIDGQRPDRDEAEEAVKTLIRWAGDDPDCEGLLDTPSRVRSNRSGVRDCATNAYQPTARSGPL